MSETNRAARSSLFDRMTHVGNHRSGGVTVPQLLEQCERERSADTGSQEKEPASAE